MTDLFQTSGSSPTVRTETAKIVLTEAQLPQALRDGLLVRSSFDAAPAVRIVVRDPSTGALGSLRVPVNKP